ncbi:hypothetical protein GA0070607_5487 [Micromonospora coriariae]|uniref:Uncharacterized protein n=1 Tax=Micromonospora coriariae TaxID=285665 RepID=A0A1C4XME2_9ACTN|nr:hypothetical protein [Micromonospora coriariae]SCF09583.1 hypothetical protein GA0070607_5487 [Micromonospora coriariae]
MQIAGSVSLSAVMDELRLRRAVFHSEADFQHAFAWAVHRLDGAVHVRLEVRQKDSEYLDLLCFGTAGRTAIEFKYFTDSWDGIDPGTGEAFRLHSHAASDLARRNFLFDVARLEKFCRSSSEPMNGLAIMLTNDRTLWVPPAGSRPTRDREFRIHEGRRLTGVLRWGVNGSYFLRNQRDLAGDYPLIWHDFSRMDGPNGEFRWLPVHVENAQVHPKEAPADTP